MSFIMKDEDDLLESRPTTKMFSRKTKSDRSIASHNVSIKSAASSTLAIDAQLLTYANNQAKCAARSIIVSGGTEDTALKTAKAAAQSVLINHHEALLTKGPKGMLLKRKIKKQAEVVASMALVLATNAIRNNQWDTIPEDDLRMMQLNSEGGSTISSLPPPTQTQQKTPKPPFVSFITPSGRSFMVGTIEEEDSRSLNGTSPIQSFVSSHASSDQEMIHRPVTIRVETKGGNQTCSSTRRASSRRQHHHNLARDVPDEGPIYALPESPKGTDTSDDDDDDKHRRDRRIHHHGDLDLIFTPSVDSSAADDDTLGTIGVTGTAGTQASFMQNVDPYIFGFTSVFRCFESASAAVATKDVATTDAESEVENGVNSFVEDYATFHGASEDSHDEQHFSQQESDDDDDDVGYDEHHAIGHSQDTGTSEESYDERPMSRKSKLRLKMKRLIGRNNRRNVTQNRSDSLEEDRDEYSSDSREVIMESGDSSESSGSSESEEEQQQREYGKKAARLGGWRSHRQRHDSATKGVYA